MTENQCELEKLQRAAQLIEEMSQGRLQVLPSVVGHVYVRPKDDAYLGLDLHLNAIPNQERYQVQFSAYVRRMGAWLDAKGLHALLTEVGQTYALLTALERQKFCPSPEDLAVFREQLTAQQVQEQFSPVMG